MKIITFIGRNGVGKSTAAEEMQVRLEDEGYNVQRLAFANPLKAITGKYLKVDKIENRKVLEDFSHDLKELFGIDIYARALVNQIDKDADFVLIDDMRYPVELDVLLDTAETYVIHCQRPSCFPEDTNVALMDRDRLAMFLIHMAKQQVEVFENIYACTRIAVESIVETLLRPEEACEPDVWIEENVDYEIFDSQGYSIVTLKFPDGTKRGYFVGDTEYIDRDALEKMVKEQIVPMWCRNETRCD
jgi:hypothetical protein